MKIVLGIALLVLTFTLQAQKFKSSSSIISFLSETAFEDIYGESKKSQSVLVAEDKQIAILMKTNSFIFKNPMMQKHFQEDYMECDKFPKATFNGTIIGDFDVEKDGEYPVTVKGKLMIHGVEKDREVKGTIFVKEGVVSVEAKFAVRVADHKVKVPSVVVKNIAEVVEVSVNITYASILAKQ